MSRDDKRLVALVFAIPLTSVILGAVLFYFAVIGDETLPDAGAAPMSKTSWQSRP